MQEALLRGNEKFRNEVMPGMQELFRSLAQGQKPHTLLVTCSDSRLVPHLFVQAQPGELFVVRNAGNLVPRYGEDEACAAAIEYALEALGVRHVAVCGHSGCGAMQAVVEPEAVKALPAVARWLRHAQPTRQALEQARTEAPLRFAIAHNAVAQLDNLVTHPCVRKRLDAGELLLTAWLYQIPTGQLELLERRTGG